MTSKGGAAGSASERVLFLARRGRKRMTCPSNLFQVNSVKVKGGWTAFQAFLATVGRLVSMTFVVCTWEERAEHRLVGPFRNILSNRRSSTGVTSC